MPRHILRSIATWYWEAFGCVFYEFLNQTNYKKFGRILQRESRKDNERKLRKRLRRPLLKLSSSHQEIDIFSHLALTEAEDGRATK